MAKADSVDHTQITILIAVATALTCISTIVMSIRVWLRFFAIKKAGMDDYMAIGALIFTIGYLGILYVAKTNGMGLPMGTLTPVEMETLLKRALNHPSCSCTIDLVCMSTNILLFVFFIICIGVVVGQCRPLEKAWDITMSMPGSCINATAFFYFTSIFGIILDVWILALPIPTLKHLHISKRSRKVLYGVFGAGGLATAFSCARLYSVRTYTMATDPFRDSTLVNVWSMVEVNVAIWCACAPALKPLFSPNRFLDSRKTTSRNYHSLNGPGLSKKVAEGSTSRSRIIPFDNSNHSVSPRGSSTGPEDIELERPSHPSTMYNSRRKIRENKAQS
ncbi:hypothetical protein M434DRAFT_383078 [Hypoxylon sp. CO27-5]|nr:hypothetical protein M434DRAFT_383078 [Hypoxylon sp. CO27-5]